MPTRWQGVTQAVAYPLATFLGAFLLFLIQPLLGKAFLPRFGGAASVWTAALLFFQCGLLAGYLYAWVLARACPLRWQPWVHAAALAGAASFLPVSTDAGAAGAEAANETCALLASLAAVIGGPFVVAAATAPLVQSWFAVARPGYSPYALYAISNVGALAALLGFPFLIEPWCGVRFAALGWSAVYLIFAVATAGCGFLALGAAAGRTAAPDSVAAGSGAGAPGAGKAPRAATHRSHAPRHEQPAAPSIGMCARWLGLSSLGTGLLMATTNHVCQDLAVIPFLWVLPLSLYLATYIWAFRRQRGPWRSWLPAAAAAALLAAGVVAHDKLPSYFLVVLLPVSAMTLGCSVCHGELARLQPGPAWLPAYYLLLAAGGVLAGTAVAIVAPVLFAGYWEWNLCLAAAFALSCAVAWRGTAALPNGRRRWLLALPVLGLFWLAARAFPAEDGLVASTRGFYGVLRTYAIDPDHPEWSLHAVKHGATLHGMQFMAPHRRRQPLGYYAPSSGVGQVLASRESAAPRRIGVVGLGAGTLAAYGRRGDRFRFYEINPHMVRIAREHFTYLGDTAATVEIVLSDARAALEREAPQQFDVLVLDAFSGDAVPTHLLTGEAFRVYLVHLAREGVIAVHVSNRYLNLEGVLEAVAVHHRLSCRAVRNDRTNATATLPSNWVLLARDPRAALDPASSGNRSSGHAGGAAAPADAGEQGTGRQANVAEMWTDDYSSVLHLIE